MKPFIRSSKAGFTLVELIIVIAILAILAGVAIPVYSGYIKKANQAADLQLLAAVNTSFAVACTEVGIGSTDVTGAVLKVTDGCITGVTVSGFRAGVTPIAAQSDLHGLFAALSAKTPSTTDAKAKINGAFCTYFGDNATTKLKYYEGAGNFVFRNGVFEAFDNGSDVTYPYTDSNGNAHILSVSTDDLNAYNGTTFDELGTATLTNAIDELANHVVTTFTSSIAGDPESGREPSPAFMAFLNTLDLGKKPDGTDRTIDDLTLNERANAIALWVASSSNGLNAAEIAGRMANGESPLEGGGTDGLMASYAMQYAMLMAYANTDMAASNPVVTPGGTDSFTGLAADRQAWYNALVAEYGEGNVTITSGSLTGRGQTTVTVSLAGSETQISDLFSTVSGDKLSTAGLAEVYGKVAATEGFQTYMEGQGAEDLSGYFAAMNMINDNMQNLDVYQVLNTGFTNEELNRMLSMILG